MNAHRVAVTGIGVVTPIGTGARAFWDATLAERVAVAPVTRFPVEGYSSRIAAEITDFEPAAYMNEKKVRWTDRYAQFAIAATRLALEDAAVTLAPGDDETGIYVGSALGGLAFADEQHDVFREHGIGSIRPLLAISVFVGASVSNIAMELDVRGPTVANGNSCASGTVAIGDAFRAIARGDVRRAVAGGVEAPLSPLVFGAFTVIRAMSTRNDDPLHASRPFDRDRDGFVMAEGAGILYLERLDDALARGAHVYGEISGYGTSNDAHHMSAPRPDGSACAAAMRRALEEARLTPGEIEAIDAHGSSTPLGDRTEVLAYESAFGNALARIPVIATKGQHGHALGATGAWEAALSLLAIEHGTLPRVVNLHDEEPDCRLDLVRERREARPRTVLSNSAGFGGVNAALVFRAVG